MLRVVARSLLCGLIGLVVFPTLAFALVLTLGYLFDPHCGTLGDSGGCEMGAASIGFAAIIPGFLAGIVIDLVRRRRQSRSAHRS